MWRDDLLFSAAYTMVANFKSVMPFPSTVRTKSDGDAKLQRLVGTYYAISIS
jgi:hypothetical protein